MKVAYVISTLDTGGAERLLVNLVNNLPKHTVPSILVLRRRTTIAHQINNPRARIKVIGLRSLADMRAWTKLAMELRRFRPDVIHSHMTLSNWACRLLKPLSGARALVNHEHGLSAWRTLPQQMFDRLLAPLANRIVVASETSRKIRVERFGISERRISVIPNALDCSFWSTPPPSQGHGCATRWGIAARLIPLKRIDLALQLLTEARKGGYPCELWIAGDGPEKPRLEERIEDLGIQAAVRFLGHVEDMRNFYSEIDVFLVTSASEDCPMSVLEALASGRFVAAMGVGGLPELLEKVRDSMVIEEDGDISAAAKALARVPAGFDSESNREYCRRHDIHAYVQRTISMYEKLLKEKSAGG
jgi:glycosyltransferase involved in cell wall biosynthesis